LTSIKSPKRYFFQFSGTSSIFLILNPKDFPELFPKLFVFRKLKHFLRWILKVQQDFEPLLIHSQNSVCILKILEATSYLQRINSIPFHYCVGRQEFLN